MAFRLSKALLSIFTLCVAHSSQWFAGVYVAGASGNCTTLNFALDMPVGCFGSYEMTSNSPSNNAIAIGIKNACQATINVNNNLNGLKTPPVSGNAPIFDQQIQWQGQCYNVNVLPVYRAVFADVQDDVNIPRMSMLADQLCRNDANSPPQIITAIDGTLTNSLLYSALALGCQAYQIPSITTLYADDGFSVKSNYPLTARNIPNGYRPHDVMFKMMQTYGWTRLAILSAVNLQDHLTYVQGLAPQYNAELYVQIIAAGMVNCSAVIQNIIDREYRVIYLLGQVPYLQVCVNELVVQRPMLANNYIIVLDTAYFGAAGYKLSGLPSIINANVSALSGLFALMPVLNIHPIYSAYLAQLAALGQVNPPPTNGGFTPMGGAATLANQGVIGMLGERLAMTLTLLNQSAAAQASNSFGPTQAVQNFTNTLLSALSINGGINASALSYSTADQITFNISVPFSSIRYNTTRVYYFFTNASGMTMVSGSLGAGLIHDNRGDICVKTALANFNGGNQNVLAIQDQVYNTYTLQPPAVTWPNMATVSQYANGIPPDRAPTTSTQLICIACKSPLVPVDPSSTLYSQLPNVKAAYELDIPQDNAAAYTINPVCDGTAPVTETLLPLISQLSSNTNNINAPVYQQVSTGTISIYPALLVSTIKQLSLSSSFAVNGALSPISSLTALAAINSPVSIVSVANDDTGAFVVEFLVTCKNAANSASAVLRLSIQARADEYTPAASTQTALIALNSIGLFMVCALMVLVTVKREDRAIFSSSFFFLMVILVGFLLLFVSSLLSILPATAAICQSKVLTFHFGFTIALGSIFAKNYRLHRIFNSKNLMNLSLSNSGLMGAVLGLLAIDAIVISSWIAGSGVDIESVARPHCYTSGNDNIVFPAVLAGLKGLLLLSGIYVSFRVRAVPANFNESRYIGLVIYNTTMLSIVYCAVFFGFSLQANSLSIFTSVVLFVGAVMNLLLFYIPKVMGLRSIFFMGESSNTALKGSMYAGTRSPSAPQSPDITKGTGDDEEKVAAAEKANSLNESDRRKVLAKRVLALKDKYLARAKVTKKSELELTRQQQRMQELTISLATNYDQLREYCMDIRLNCERMKKYDKHSSSANGAGTDQDLAVLAEVEQLIDLPLDRIDFDNNSDSYTVVDAKTVSRRKISLNAAATYQQSNVSGIRSPNPEGNARRGTAYVSRRSSGSQPQSTPINVVGDGAVVLTVDNERAHAAATPSTPTMSSGALSAPLAAATRNSSISYQAQSQPVTVDAVRLEAAGQQ